MNDVLFHRARFCLFHLIALCLFLLPGCPRNVKQASSLDRIPPPRTELYKDIRDGKDWLNPIVIIYTKEIEVRSGKENWRGAPELVVEQLARLDVTAWPYGRVVMMHDVGIISGMQDVPLIRRNREFLQKALAEAGVLVVLFPS